MLFALQLNFFFYIMIFCNRTIKYAIKGSVVSVLDMKSSKDKIDKISWLKSWWSTSTCEATEEALLQFILVPIPKKHAWYLSWI